jgi:copper chaperone
MTQMSPMTHAVLNSPAISCAHCKLAIESALGRLDGVAAVAVSVEDKSVDVRFDAERVGLPAIEQTMADEGYEVVGEHTFGS